MTKTGGELLAMINILDYRIRRLFRRDLAKLSRINQRERKQFTLLNADVDLTTYYTEPTTRKMARVDFETGGCKNSKDLETMLIQLWSSENRVEFINLSRGTAKIATSLKANDEQSAELSNFIYVMY